MGAVATVKEVTEGGLCVRIVNMCLSHLFQIISSNEMLTTCKALTLHEVDPRSVPSSIINEFNSSQTRLVRLLNVHTNHYQVCIGIGVSVFGVCWINISRKTKSTWASNSAFLIVSKRFVEVKRVTLGSHPQSDPFLLLPVPVFFLGSLTTMTCSLQPQIAPPYHTHTHTPVTHKK